MYTCVPLKRKLLTAEYLNVNEIGMWDRIYGYTNPYLHTYSIYVKYTSIYRSDNNNRYKSREIFCILALLFKKYTYVKKSYNRQGRALVILWSHSYFRYLNKKIHLRI